MPRQFNNLNEVEEFLKSIAPDWVICRGKNTYISDGTKHADDYEVLQVFNPKDKSGNPFAEFWRGFYSFSPSDYEGFFGPKYGKGKNYFSCMGPLDFAVQAISDAL